VRYFDASALAKRYVREPGSVRVRRLLASDAPATSRLSAVELGSALMRRGREGMLTDADRDRALAAIERDLEAMLVVELVPVIVDRAIGLLRGHVLRAGDAIQLASCLHLRDAFEADVTFVAFDERLVAAARKERLRLA
jgi:predicted nucleic acid-binding protein